MIKNWRTTLFGTIQNISWSSVLLAISSPEIMEILTKIGIGPIPLVILGGISKILKDLSTKDANVTGGHIPATPEAEDRLEATK